MNEDNENVIRLNIDEYLTDFICIFSSLMIQRIDIHNEIMDIITDRNVTVTTDKLTESVIFHTKIFEREP